MDKYGKTVKAEYFRHKFNKGDSIEKIALKYFVRPIDITNVNNLKDKNVELNRILLIPYRGQQIIKVKKQTAEEIKEDERQKVIVNLALRMKILHTSY